MFYCGYCHTTCRAAASRWGLIDPNFLEYLSEQSLCPSRRLRAAVAAKPFRPFQILPDPPQAAIKVFTAGSERTSKGGSIRMSDGSTVTFGRILKSSYKISGLLVRTRPDPDKNATLPILLLADTSSFCICNRLENNVKHLFL